MRQHYFIQFATAIFFVFLFLLLTPDISAQQSSVWDHVPDEIRERNSFQRLEWFYRQRAMPYDTISYYTYMAEKRKEIQKAIREEANQNLLQWSSIGPDGVISGFPSHWGEMSGRVRGLSVDPTNPMIVYIGAAAGGIWKTTNGGTSWADIGYNLASLTFGSIAIDPNNSNNVYAGSGEVMFSFNPIVYDGQGLYKSTDGGTSWNQITNGFGSSTHFGDLEVSPHNSNILLAALGSGYWYLGNLTNEGIWRSTNAGQSWTRTLNVQDGFDVIFHPTNSTLAYSAVGGGLSTSGFYISTDAGASWTQSNTGLPNSFSIRRIQIDIAKSSPSTLYAFIYDGAGGTPKMYKSTNGGSNWSIISAGTQLGGNYGSGWLDQGWYDLCVAVNPTNANHVFVGNLELHQTTNGSAFSVKRISGGSSAWDSPAHVDYHRIVFAPSNSNYVYVGCDGGVYKSTDAGNTWSSANSLISTLQFYRIASHPGKRDTLVGGAQDNGNFKTYNRGATPWTFSTTGDGMECFFDHTTPNVVYFSTQNTSLYKSTNSGATVSFLTSLGGAWLSPFFMHPTNNQWLYTATDDVYRSTNAGGSFNIIANNVVTSDFINTMAQSSANPNNMILAGSGFFTSTPQVKVSTDGGFIWTDITANVPGAQRYISRVITDPNNANTMYIVKSGYSAGNKIYRTTNLGTSWTSISGDLPDIPHNDFFIDPNNSTNMFAANDFGVYHSTNGGTSWNREGSGMPFVPAIDFDYVVINGTRYLRVATHGRSAFETNLDFIIPVELISFTAATRDGNVELKWTTATELNNYGFEIERTSKLNSQEESSWERIAFVPGHGTTTEYQIYKYSDYDVYGTLYYRLKQIDFDGSFDYSNIVEVDASLLSFELEQNYPNPFNPITRISYSIPTESYVTLTIFNPLGEVITVLVKEVKNPNKYEEVWDATNIPSGVYLYTIRVSDIQNSEVFIQSKKMILLK